VINIRNKEYIQAFGQRLFRLRIESGLSQEKLAHKADVPVNQVGRIERGEVNTTISTIYAISEALKISPKDLFDF
jgi:transcriptional regulator with XRE-family HTH domain